MTDSGTVFLVDDDPGVLRALTRLLRAEGLETRSFSSPRVFLDKHEAMLPGCAIIDVAMPGLDGLNLQQTLAASGIQRPVIFLSGRSDIAISVKAMKAGAIDFLTKPVDGGELLAAVRRAIAVDRQWRRDEAEVEAVRQRIAILTPREREVLQHVVAGRLNKQIAASLGTVEKTIKVHRARMMEKMHTRSVVELVRMTLRAGIAAPEERRPGAN